MIKKKSWASYQPLIGLETFTLKTQEKNKKLQIIWHASSSIYYDWLCQTL